MSLSRAQWIEMLEMTKQIERDSDYLYMTRRDISDRIKRNVKTIQSLIESVIGQIE